MGWVMRSPYRSQLIVGSLLAISDQRPAGAAIASAPLSIAVNESTL